MPNPQLPPDKSVIVPQVRGLNERSKFTNPEISEFDELKGLIPQRNGILQRANGIKFLQLLGEGAQVINMHQTFDRRKNFLVQTNVGVYLYSEDELLNRVLPTNLIPTTSIEEEEMAKAILITTVASGVASPGIIATSWTTAPIGAILSQRNPDGSLAAFVTALAADTFTLAAGGYRFSIRSQCSDNALPANMAVIGRLFNVTTGFAAWVGLANETSPTVILPVSTPNQNGVLQFGGDLELTVPTQFRVQHYAMAAAASNAFGAPGGTGFPEVYRWIEILQTHA